MKIYIAASFDDRERIALVAERLSRQGHQITSTWIFQEVANANDNPEKAPIFAWRDMTEVEAADVLIIDTTLPSTGGGRHVELGLAIAWKKKIYLVGHRENIFYHHPLVRHMSTFDHVADVLSIGISRSAGKAQE